MIGSTARRSIVEGTAFFAYAAGVTGILANLFLLAFFALKDSYPEVGPFFGPANDLVGSVSTAFMIPVALALSTLLPDRRSAGISLVVGLSAMVVLVAGGPLLVLGVLSFEIQAPIAVTAGLVLYAWLFLINRWLRLSGALRPRVVRLGGFLAAVTMAGGAVAGFGYLLPWLSWPQLILFSVGGVLVVIGMLGTPFWFLLLGRHLAAP